MDEIKKRDCVSKWRFCFHTVRLGISWPGLCSWASQNAIAWRQFIYQTLSLSSSLLCVSIRW